jgi:hypothetical protein
MVAMIKVTMDGQKKRKVKERLCDGDIDINIEL